MALSLVGVSAAPIFGTTTATATLPAGYTVTADDRAYLLCVNKRAATTTPATPSGWTSLGTVQVGTGATGAGTGPLRLTIFFKDLVGGDTVPAVTISGTGAVIGVVCAIYRKGATETFNHAVVSMDDTGSSTTFSGTYTANPGLDSGDQFAILSGLTLSTATFGATTIDIATGATIGTITERADHATTNGDDLRYGLDTGAVTAGSCTVAPHTTCTLGSATTGGAYLLRVRAVAPGTNPEFIAYYENNQGTTVTTTTASFTPAAGETILVKCYNDNPDAPNVNTISGGGLTYDLVHNESLANYSECWIYAADVGGTSPGAMTVSVTWTGTDGRHGIIVERYRNTQKPTGLINTPIHGASGAPSSTATTTVANSLISWVNTDWQSVPGSATYRANNVEIYRMVHALVTTSSAYVVAATAGAYTLGQSAPTGQAWTLLAVELKPVSGGGGGTATFGQTTDGGAETSSSADRKKVSSFTPSSSGTAESISIRARVTAENTVIKGVIYANSGGNPGALLAVSNEITINSTTKQEWTATFSGANRIAITSGTPYWIGFHNQDPGTGGFAISRGGTSSMSATNTDTYSDLPTDPFGTPVLESGPIDAYVTYSLPATVQQGTVGLTALPSITTAGVVTKVSTVTLVELPTITTAGVVTKAGTVNLTALPSIGAQVLPFVHSSSPPLVPGATGTGPVTTATFTPPPDALLVAVVGANQNTLTDIAWAMSSTGVTGLTWTTAIDGDTADAGNANCGASGILVAQLPPSGIVPMTVTMNSNGAGANYIKLYVVVNARSGVAAIGQTTKGTFNNNQIVSGSLTTRAGDLVLFGATEWQASSPLASSEFAPIEQFDTGSTLSAVVGQKTMGTGDWQFSSVAASPRWTYSIVEIIGVNVAVGVTQQGTVGLTATPSITTDGLRTAVSSVSLVALPVITTVPLRTAVSSVTLVQLPTISAAGLREAVATVTLVELPTITVGQFVIRPSTVSLSVLPSITTDGQRIAVSSVTLVQLPTLTTDAFITRFSTVTLSLLPSIVLTATGFSNVTATVTLVQLPTIAAGAKQEWVASVNLVCLPTVAVGGTRVGIGSVLLSQAVSITVAGIVTAFGTVTLSLIPSITIAGLVTKLGSVLLTALPTVTVEQFVFRPATVSLVALPLIDALSGGQTSGTVSLVVLPTVDVGGLRTAVSSVLLTLSPSLTVGVTQAFAASVSLLLAPSVVVAGGLRTVPAAVTLVQLASVAVGADRFAISTALLIQTATISAVGEGLSGGSVVLVVTPAITISSRITHSASAVLVLLPSITAGAFVLRGATVSLVQTATLSVGTFGLTAATVTLIQSVTTAIGGVRVRDGSVYLVLDASTVIAGLAEGFGLANLTADVSISVAISISSFIVVHLVQQVMFGAGGAKVVGGQATLIALARFFAYITVADVVLPITITGINRDGFRSGRWTRQPSVQWPRRAREPSWTKQDSGARLVWPGT